MTDRLAGMHVYAVYAVYRLDLALNSSRIRRILLNFGARARRIPVLLLLIMLLSFLELVNKISQL